VKGGTRGKGGKGGDSGVEGTEDCGFREVVFCIWE
jgi:hypothetical protein